jgi:hypothetical protein
MVVALVLYFGGVVAERQVLASHPALSSVHTSHAVTTETGGDGDSAAHADAAPKAGVHSDNGNEQVLGIAVEEPLFVAASAVAWLLLISALLLFGRPALLALCLIAGASCVLDVGEVVRQIHETQSGLALLAALVAVAHGTVAVLALMALRRPVRPAAAGDLTPTHVGG